jgi:hypothetical protein
MRSFAARWLVPFVVPWLALAIGRGCGHDAKPAVPPQDHAPLPPGTPIGYLIDNASELQLRDDQLVKLKEIDSDLAGRLDALDARAHGPAAASSGPAAGGRHRGGRGGGRMRRGGAGGGSGSAAARPSAGSAASTAVAGGKTEERADDVRAAIEQAFAVLDPAQQPIAKRVLSDHGVDLDAGRPEPGHPEAEPDEPDTGGGSGSN